MRPQKRRRGVSGPGLFLALFALLAIPAFPVLAGGKLLDFSGATPTADASLTTPPALEPTSLLDYPPLPGSRPASYKAPLQLRAEDHYWFDRPIPSTYHNWIDPDYPYGSNLSGEMSVHTGVDIPADSRLRFWRPPTVWSFGRAWG